MSSTPVGGLAPQAAGVARHRTGIDKLCGFNSVERFIAGPTQPERTLLDDVLAIMTVVMWSSDNSVLLNL